ncbi:MAG: hypothetical protein JWN94_4204 [Betaproteobacteria bacterium]|nr:hypothetical protein [Betaproteobacteria bacterium]
MSKFLTWLDIEREIRRRTLNGTVLPDCLDQIACYPDGIEVSVHELPKATEAVAKVFKQWFGANFNSAGPAVLLDLGNATLPIEIIAAEGSKSQRTLRPLWQDIGLIPSEGANVPTSLPQPRNLPESLRCVAFHSFKGGVGRTTALLTFVKALVDRANERNDPKKILIVDADLEAPGLTYILGDSQKPTVSLVNLLEAIQLSTTPYQETVNYFANELLRSPIRLGVCEIYVLPSFLDEHQLIDLRVLPAHLTKRSEGAWSYASLLVELTQALKAQFLFIDLRAGLSEISSPIIFDPRIDRFLVSTVSQQSVSGTSFILRNLAAMLNGTGWRKTFTRADPQILVSMLIPELKDSEAYTKLLTSFESAYAAAESPSDSPLDSALSFIDIYWDANLLNVKSIDEALGERLRHSSLYPFASAWAADQELEIVNPDLYIDPDSNAAVTRLKETCARFEFGEQGLGNDLLITDSIRNFATQFYDTLPNVISIGAKGSGKTFTYIQLCRLQTWKKFLNKATAGASNINSKATIFPVTQSLNLGHEARLVIENARATSFKSTMPFLGSRFSATDFKDRIDNALAKNTNWSKAEWASFWIRSLARSVGVAETELLSELCDEFQSVDQSIVFLFDGLEELFPRIAEDQVQREALTALIELPNRLEEIQGNPIGIVVFLREDYVKAVVPQNRGQFEKRYDRFRLLWDADSFLRLAYWICAEAKIIGAKQEALASYTREKLLTVLTKLWGHKLGPSGSREAYSANWIYAALTDLKGRLQARDIVRFLKFAAANSEGMHGGSPLEWTDRLLLPRAVRNALEPCSRAKVDEAVQEYTLFRAWVNDMNAKDPTLKRIPFDPRLLGIHTETLEMLKDIGVVFEDRDTDDQARFYIPEIYRAGLGFALDKGARPRVIVLQKRALGTNF